MGSVPVSDRVTRLTSCWVRKEAYLKGIGTGLGVDPATVPVGIEPTPVRLGEWAVLDLPQLGPAHVGGLAVAVGDAPVPAVVVRDLVDLG